ncbi:hypothetical protein [Desulfolucanica intricata]|uniref:hypothetical protein n=1 Tax=Desulfolucanica intricata TaxID=1285191 RepID=UPI00082B5CC4|nr:hypothetical protein [Desulfolucanica intricata]
MTKIPAFAATGIGSVPHTNPPEALKLINEYLETIPHWPQLPKISSLEGLIGQNTALLAKIGLIVNNGQRAPYFDTTQPDWAEKLTHFYSLYLEAIENIEKALDKFAYPAEYAAGFYTFLEHFKPGKYTCFIKGHVTGPITLGLTITDQDRRSAYYNSELKDIVIKVVEQEARWQVKTMSRFQLPTILFVDEPGLYSYGQSTHITLKSEEIISELNQVFNSISAAGGIPGVHCCASTDWSMLFQSKAKIISFDAFEYFDKFAAYSYEITDFLERGGYLAWGIVPTSGKIISHSPEILVKMLNEQLNTLIIKGIPEDKLKNQSLVTPSCGTGTLSTELAEKVYTATKQVSKIMQGT